MTAIDFNPNFTGCDDRHVTTREILAELFDHGGLVTREMEERAASQREKLDCRAYIRTWETATSEKYSDRRRAFADLRPPEAKETFDIPREAAEEELERLMRAPDPAEHGQRINQYRAVLKRYDVQDMEPIDFTPPPPPAPAQEELRRKAFLDTDYKEQEALVAAETNVEFLEWVGTVGRIMPVVKTKAAARIEELRKGKKK